MKKHAQSGFAIVELVVVVVILIAVVATGYYVWHNHNQKNPVTTADTSSSSNYQSPPVTTPTAPQVNNASDLSGAMQALNQTDVAAGNADNTQLSTQSSAF